MSTIATSGLCTATCSSRSSALPDWAATSKPASSSRRATPSRRSTESSASTTRMRSSLLLVAADGNLRAELGAAARRALDDEAPVQRLDAVGEPAQARAAARVGAADAVVGDADAGDAVPALDADADGRGLRVLDDVRHPLGDHVVRGRL